MVKWEPYKKGLIRAQLKKEIKEIGDKDWRKKKGLEDTPLLDFKKNTHYLLHATVELTEMLMSRFDGIMKGTYLALEGQLTKSFKNIGDKVNNDIKNLGFMVKRANTEANAEMTKKLKQSSMRENKILAGIKEVREEQNSILATTRDDILKASKGIIKAVAREITNFRSNMEIETDEMSDRMEKVEENILNFLNTMDSDFSVTIKEKMGEIAKAIQVFNGELSRRSQSRAKVDDERFKQLDGKLEDLILKSHVAQRSLTDTVTKNLEEVKIVVENELDEFSKETQISLDESRKFLSSETKNTIQNIKELTGIVQDNYVDTRDMLKVQNKQLMDTLTKNQQELKRNMEREISEVRNLIANIRGDIELIKTFLTKLHA